MNEEHNSPAPGTYCSMDIAVPATEKDEQLQARRVQSTALNKTLNGDEPLFTVSMFMPKSGITHLIRWERCKLGERQHGDRHGDPLVRKKQE